MNLVDQSVSGGVCFGVRNSAGESAREQQLIDTNKSDLHAPWRIQNTATLARIFEKGIIFPLRSLNCFPFHSKRRENSTCCVFLADIPKESRLVTYFY